MGYGDCLLLRCDNTSVRDCCRCEGHGTSVLVRLCTTGVGQTASCGIHLRSVTIDLAYEDRGASMFFDFIGYTLALPSAMGRGDGLQGAQVRRAALEAPFSEE